MLTATNIRRSAARPRGSLATLPAIILVGAASIAAAVPVDIGNGAGTVGDTITVQVSTGDLTGLDVLAYELRLHWYAPQAQLLDAPTAGTLTAPWGAVTLNAGEGTAVIAAAGSTPLAGAGVLLDLEFLLGPVSGTVILYLDLAVFNEGDPAAETSNGSISIQALPVIYISPNSAEILVGDVLEFSATGGTPPYTYGSTDPAVANFAAQFLLALAPGSVRAFVADDAGATDTTTANIDVRAISLSAWSDAGQEGEVISLPMVVSNTSPYDVHSAEFSVTYDENKLTALGATIDFGLAEQAGWPDPVFNIEPGRITITMAGANPLSGSSTLALVDFLIDEVSYNTTATVTPIDGLFNEIYPALHVAGSIAITNAPELWLTPDTGIIVAGDALQFYISGQSTPPFTWGVTNPAAAFVDGDGLLTALAGGETRVFVTDFVGSTDTTGVIDICDLYVSLPRDTLVPGVPTLVPVMPDRDVAGLGIMGYELTVEFNSLRIEALGATSAGCASEAWGAPVVNVQAGRIIVVHAGVTAMSGALPLVYLELQATAELYGTSSTLSFAELRFNEGDPCALTNNGLLELPTGAAGTPPVDRPLLWQNYPNPFNPTTRIDYSLPGPGRACLRVHGLSGEFLRELVDRQHDSAGRYTAVWDGRDRQGRPLPSGVYFAVLETAAGTQRSKLVLIK